MPWMKEASIDKLYNSPKMKSLRAAFLNGEEPDECNWCWKEEAAGVKSFREKYIERGYTYDTDNPTPQILDLKLSNTCNMKCRMCGPQASSAIAKEQKIVKPYLHSNKILNTDNEDVFFNEWLPNVKELELTGGEPFFSKENKDLIFKISKTEYAKNIFVKITTNGMFYDKKMLDALKNFKVVAIPFSIDDVGSRLEYARGDSDWNIISKNIINMKKEYPQFDVSIYRTINNYNIYYLNDLDTWARDQGFSLADGFLHSPSYLNIQNLPQNVKEEISSRISDKNVLSFMNSTISANVYDTLNEFFSSNKNLDEIRNQSFEDSFPEFAELILWN
jgi:MoaA/NifB/PqqE/SkfB family radical SAM enzyme